MSKIHLKIYINILLLSASSLLFADDKDSLTLSQSLNLPDKNIFERVYDNPATAFYRPDGFRHGDLSITYDYANSKDLHLIQDGDQNSQYKLMAEGFTIENNKAFWGKVGYRNFRQKNVRWNDVYDYTRLGPYLIADSIGGNSQGEEYSLSGGLAIKYDKWTFAGEAGYIAGHNYRKKDPRPRSTSTDLYLQLSAAYSVSHNYQLGTSLEVNKYREKPEIKVERTGDSYTFYSLRGFGSYSPKYTEANATSLSKWLYEGNTYKANLYFVPLNKTGFIGNLSLGYGYTDANYTQTNEKPYTLKTYNVIADLGWQHWGENNRSFIKLNYDYNLGKGIERIYYYQKVNDTFGQYFLLIASKFYTQKSVEAKLTAGHEWLSDKSVKWVSADFGHRTDKELYAFPQYKMVFKRWLSSVKAGGEFQLKGASSFVAEATASYSPCISSELLLPEDNIIFDQSIRPNISIWNADFIGGGLMLKYQYKIKNMYQLYTSVNGSYQTDKDNSRYSMIFAVGVKY